MSDCTNKNEVIHDNPFDISEITAAYESIHGDPFDISGLTAAIESKAGKFAKKISADVLVSAGISRDKAAKMYNDLVTFMCKKGWLAYCENEEDTNRVILHNWKETADHLIEQGYFDGDNITEIGRKYLKNLYKTIVDKADDCGWTVDEMLVKAKDDAKAKAVATEMGKMLFRTFGILGAYAMTGGLMSPTLLSTLIYIITLMISNDVGVNSMDRVRGYYEGNLIQRDTSAYESVATESIASTLDSESKKEVEKDDNKKENFIDLNSLYKIAINSDAIDKYKDKFHQLYRINKNARKLCGYMYFMNSTGKKGDLVAFVAVKNQSGKNWVDCLEVCPEYRGNKLSHQLLDVASKEFDATEVIIDAGNKFAIRVFNKYGFMPYLDRDGKVYMSTDSDTVQSSNYKPTKESTEPATEAAFKKPDKNSYTKSVIERLGKSLKTPEKRVNYEKTLTQNMSVFKSTITELKRLEFRHERDIITEQNYFKDRATAEKMLKRLASQVGLNINVFVNSGEVLDIEGYLDAYDALKNIKNSL